MELVLLAVTIVSLIVAFVMSVAAWRLSREERARSAARVAALAAAASETNVQPPRESPMPVVQATETEAEPIAVGESRSAAPWQPTRVSAFASTTRHASPARPAVVDELPLQAPALNEGFLGSSIASPPSSGRQRGLAVAATILFVIALAGGYWTVYGERSGATAPAVRASDASPLELVSLRHERRGGRLSVTGLVRNPSAGAPVEKLSAVVFLFDQQGGFITSARADVDFLKLSPGDESPFAIAVDAPSNVARYRVSFRNDAGIVPHVDRRGQEPIAPNSVGQNATAVR